MMAVPSRAEPEIAHVPEAPADPRGAAWHHYRMQALGAVCAAEIIIGELRGLLDGSSAGGFDEFAQTISALELLHHDIGVACQGLAAIQSTSGVA